MKKIIIALLVVVSFLSVDHCSAANPTGTPEVFKMTFMKLTMVKDGGAVVVVNNTPAEVDLAAVNAGASLGEVMSGNIVPGTYTQMNSTVSMTVTMKGAVLSGTTNIYYTHDTVVDVGPAAPPALQTWGKGCVPGLYVLNAAAAGVGITDIATWLAAGSPTQGSEPVYGQCTIRPPSTDPTLTVSIDGTEVLSDGDVMDEEIEVDVVGALDLVDVGMGVVYLFPGQPSITFL